jgi:hypothetical protein
MEAVDHRPQDAAVALLALDQTRYQARPQEGPEDAPDRGNAQVQIRITRPL